MVYFQTVNNFEQEQHFDKKEEHGKAFFKDVKQAFGTGSGDTRGQKLLHKSLKEERAIEWLT